MITKVKGVSVNYCILLIVFCVLSGCSYLTDKISSRSKTVAEIDAILCKKNDQKEFAVLSEKKKEQDDWKKLSETKNIWELLSGRGEDVLTRAQMRIKKYDEVTERKIVIFIDGTGNISASNTNIWKLYTLASIESCDSPIIPFYHKGIGTSWGLHSYVEQIFGSGINQHIIDTYKFLAQTYRPGDKIYIFGFSRGAYTARALNGMIEFVGLLEPNSHPQENGNMSQIDEQINALFQSYARKNDGRPNWSMRLRNMIQQDIITVIPKLSFQRYKDNGVKVEGIGLFDTVSALGVGRDDFPDKYRTDLYARKGYHALSIDEQRDDFRPLFFDNPINNSRQELKEVWFAGAHADIGGGYQGEDGLASVSRQWMIKQFLNSGIFPKKAEYIYCNIEDSPCELGRMHDEFLDNDLFGEFGLHWRKIAKDNLLHGSVICRHRAENLPKFHTLREPNKRYEPENLYLPLKDSYKFEDYKCN